jgi:hypothetical protein
MLPLSGIFTKTIPHHTSTKKRYFEEGKDLAFEKEWR